MADINLTAAEVAQLILSIGNAAALSTKDKTSLVAAINETLATAEAGGSPKAEKVSYSGNIDGTTVANVKAALDALTAREQALVVRFTKQSSGTITADKTIADILAAHSSGKPVTGIYASGDYQLLEAQGSVAYFASWTGVDTFMLKGAASAGVDSWTLERLDIKGTNVALKGNIDGEDFTTVAGAIAILNRRGADHVAYSGTIGETTVENVKAALDALAARKAGASEAGDVTCNIKIGDEGAAPATAQNVSAALELLSYGMPLNARSDFTASGATSAAGWACRASGSTSNYAVAEGFYQILVGDEINYVRVFGVRKNAPRVVQIWKHGRDYIDPTIEIWRCTAPGATPEMLLRYGADRGDLTIPNQRWAWQVPDYRSAKKGQVLMASGSDVKPDWGRLPMATASAAGVVKADAKTDDDTVPARIDTDGKLWVKVPDAPLIVTATAGANNTGTVDYSSSEILAAVSAGREVYLRGNINGLTVVFAFGGTFQGEPFFYNFYTTSLIAGIVYAMVNGNQVIFAFPDFVTRDDLDMFKQGLDPQLLPGVTVADNGKFARVVNGAWAAQALTNVSEVGA